MRGLSSAVASLNKTERKERRIYLAPMWCQTLLSHLSNDRAGSAAHGGLSQL